MIYPPIAFKILKKTHQMRTSKLQGKNYHKKFAIETGTGHGTFPPYFMKEIYEINV